MMNLEHKDDSDASNVYFLLQIIYLFKGKKKPLDNLVVETIKQFSLLYPNYKTTIDAIIAHLEADEAFKALRLAHHLLQEDSKSSPQVPLN